MTAELRFHHSNNCLDKLKRGTNGSVFTEESAHTTRGATMTAMSNAGPKLEAEHAMCNGDASGSVEVSMGKSTPSDIAVVIGVAFVRTRRCPLPRLPLPPFPLPPVCFRGGFMDR